MFKKLINSIGDYFREPVAETVGQVKRARAKRVRNDDHRSRAMAIYHGLELIPAKELTCHQNGDRPRKGLSYERLVSRAARFYPFPSQRVRGPRMSGRFTDVRGVPYQVTEDGSVRRVREAK